jgi:plastocyanin
MKSLILVLLACLTMTGCVMFEEQVNVTENVTEPPPPPPAPTPSFSISSPLSGELVMIAEEYGDINLVMSTSNLILRPDGGMKKIGEGHFMISIDGELPVKSSSKIFVIPAMTAGEHNVEVELVHNDETSYSPKIVQSVSYTVEQEEPEEYVPQEYTVDVQDFTYEPESLTVKVSDKVTFTNKGNFPRSATCFIGGSEVFDTEVIASGDSVTITMNRIMECEYYSITHMAMKGTIKVESNGMEVANTKTSDMTDCGTDLTCFTNAAKNCNKVKVNHNIAVSIFGVDATTDYLYEVRGMEGGKCNFYIKTVDNSLKFPAGTSQSTIDQQNDIYEDLKGREGTCKTDSSEIVTLVDNWSSGRFATNDFDNMDCQGNFFENR